jgi:hypothetical protein
VPHSAALPTSCRTSSVTSSDGPALGAERLPAGMGPLRFLWDNTDGRFEQRGFQFTIGVLMKAYHAMRWYPIAPPLEVTAIFIQNLRRYGSRTRQHGRTFPVALRSSASLLWRWLAQRWEETFPAGLTCHGTWL